MERLRLAPGRERRVLAGHLWLYRGELAADYSGVSAGPVIVEDAKGRFLGIGDYSPASQIAVRLLTKEDEPINTGFFRRRLEAAGLLRRERMAGETSYRLVYGEGDLLPGLVVDKFGDYLVAQVLTAAMETRREMIFDLLEEVFAPAGIIERSDVSTRSLEDLELRAGLVRGEAPEYTVITENGLRFRANLLSGEKTGYFLDQKLNRAALKRYAAGRRVLDVFCHTGGFAVHAAAYGAKEVLGVDISSEAVKLAAENIALNGYKEIGRFVIENAFDFLRASVARKDQYDLVILDPPAFTKSKKTIRNACRGYKEINLRGFKLLPPGGILVTCSCSYHMSPADFLSVVREAAGDAGRTVRLLEVRSQAPDHPVLLGVPETEYLKCLILEVLD